MMSSLKLFLILYYIKQIDSKLLCVCLVIDHRGRQNVVRTSVTHSAVPRVPLFCSYHILTSSVIYYWTDAWQLGIYLLNRRTGMESIYLFYNTLTWVGKHPMQGNVAQFFWWSEKFLLSQKFCNIAKILWCSTNFFTIYFVLGIKPNNL